MAIKTAGDVMKFTKDNRIEIVDLKFCDVPGLWQHFSVSANEFGEDVFEDGIGFDGSSIRGFQTIDESDMLLIPDPESAFLDPFADVPTVSLTCNVRDPVTGQSYTRDPRFVAQKAEIFLKSTGVADISYWVRKSNSTYSTMSASTKATIMVSTTSTPRKGSGIQARPTGQTSATSRATRKAIFRSRPWITYRISDRK